MGSVIVNPRQSGRPSSRTFVGPRINPCVLKYRNGGKFHLDKNPKVKADKLLSSWAKLVKHRDNYKCVECGKENKLHSHHIKHKVDFPELKYDIDNGITLCSDCHANVHGGNIAKALRKFG